MPIVKLTKSDLSEFAEVLVLANTPLSLFNGIVRCSGMQKLRKSSTADLIEYYDRVTARAERSEIVAGLSYAVLCALAIHSRDTTLDIDSSRLQWGLRIWEFVKRTNVATSSILLSGPTMSPKSTYSTSAPRVALYGADGREIRNDN